MRIRKSLLAPVLGLAFAAVLAHAQTADIVASVIDQQGRPVADAVLIAVPVDGNMRSPQRPRDGSIDQVDKEFFPRVTIVPVGASVTFPNHDDVRHQVYSFSPAKRFELPLYAGVPAQPVVFDKPGVVVLGCNIHDWMVGYVYVSESPFFAKTGKDGKAVLAELPARAYVVRVWHPQLEMSEDATHKTIDVSRERRVEAAWTVTLKREVRVRRAPTSERGGTKY
ncbi:MAG TPA: methylamine utilization protein [Casimicrobiaceae bacterium]|nr:methylamine utilization protein [Casimicrobiaceae bacterium]